MDLSMKDDELSPKLNDKEHGLFRRWVGKVLYTTGEA